MSETNSKTESKLKTELRQYQSKTIEAFSKENTQIPHDVEMQKMRVDDFLRKAKEDKAPILKIIKTMKRIPKIVHDKTGKAIKKDYLEVRSELYGKDWKDNDLRVIEYYEGYHYEPIIITKTGDRDPDTGDFNMTKQHQANRQVHDIETDKNRKQVIEDMINNATGTYRDEIKLYYEVPDSNKGRGFRCNIYTYDQFINSSPEEMENLARTIPTPLHSNKDRKSYMS